MTYNKNYEGIYQQESIESRLRYFSIGSLFRIKDQWAIDSIRRLTKPGEIIVVTNHITEISSPRFNRIEI